MTIIAGFSSSRQGTAPLNLAAQIARSSGDKIIATAIVERPWPPKNDPIEDEYLRYVTSQASKALERVISRLPAELDISMVVHQSTSIPAGLMELAVDDQADVVVVGSSSSGLLGRVALGSVTERLVHTAAVPVAIAPRGYPLSPVLSIGLRPRTAARRTRSASSPPAPRSPSGGRCDCALRRSPCGR
jgi:nucleotide-binding universal stress UspA family protein